MCNNNENKNNSNKPTAKVISNLYTIRCITNLHVGTNNSNFGIIDNEVQKDEIINIPIINASSLKGALREFFTVTMGKQNENGTDQQMVTWIFGPSSSGDKSANEGNFKFFQADLLARPVRSNKKPYFLVLAPMIIDSFLDKISLLNIKIDKKLKEQLESLNKLNPEDGKGLIFQNIDNIILEDIKSIYEKIEIKEIKEFLGNENIALISDNDFKKLDLPVIARNKLENGESKNLWYEEIVPRESIFYFFVTIPTNIDTTDNKEKIAPWIRNFEESILENLVQFGGNKSIGYGFCELKKGN